MKLGLVIGQTERIGGMEKQAAVLARELQKRGIGTILFVLVSRRGRGDSRSLHLDSITVRRLYHSRYTKFLSARLLRHHCSREDITHLIGFNVENAEIAVASGFEGRIAMNVRGIRFSIDHSLAERYKETASECDILITNSPTTSDLLRQSGIAGKGETRVIRNGIELPTITVSPKNKVVLYVGSIKEVKDPITFVKACHEVLASDNDVRIVVAGDGEMRPVIERYIAENRLSGYFTMLGEVPYGEIPYREASVFVNSSLRESSCNSLLEALSFGIPVVAADNPGNSDVLSGLGDHRLVPTSNSEAMAGAIRELLSAGPDLRKRIFEESRKLIRDRYSVPRMVDDYIDQFLST